jgi:hypothetical protein
MINYDKIKIGSLYVNDHPLYDYKLNVSINANEPFLVLGKKISTGHDKVCVYTLSALINNDKRDFKYIPKNFNEHRYSKMIPISEFKPEP